MALLGRQRIPPYYAQVELCDRLGTDSPQWKTGAERVVATGSCIAVSTRPDHLGDVLVEVWSGPVDDVAHLGSSAWSGYLRVGDEGAAFGTTVGNQLIPVNIPRGE